MTNDPNIRNSLMAATYIYNEQGTLQDTEVDWMDIEEAYQSLIDPDTGFFVYSDHLTRENVRRAYKILGAKVPEAREHE